VASKSNYQWDDPLAQTTSCLYFAVAGCYTLTVTDNNGDTASQLFCIADNPGPTITISDTIHPTGPSACDDSIYPEIAAPGLYVTTTDLTFSGEFPDSYTSVSGASFAAPHLAGGMALLLSAYPEATVAQLEQALQESGQDLGEDGPDNTYGYGLVDLKGAYDKLSEILEQNPSPTGGASPVANDDSYCDIQDVAISVAAPGVLGNDTDPEDDSLTVDVTVISEPDNGTLVLNADGSFCFSCCRL